MKKYILLAVYVSTGLLFLISWLSHEKQIQILQNQCAVLQDRSVTIEDELKWHKIVIKNNIEELDRLKIHSNVFIKFLENIVGKTYIPRKEPEGYYKTYKELIEAFPPDIKKDKP